MFHALLFGALVTLSAGASTPLPESTIERVRQFRAREDALPIQSNHRSVLHVVGEADGRPVRTRHAVLIVHGLFYSPNELRGIEDHFVAKGMNVLNLRLAGHFEPDRTAITSTVHWSEWMNQVHEAQELVHALGDEVVFVGHSTGALALTWEAIRHPRHVAGLALFAPAFKVHLSSTLLAHVTNALKFSWATPTGRVLNGYAGLQVHEMARAFWRELADKSNEGESAADVAARRLREVPVWMANTAIDTVIDQRTANSFFGALELWGEARREKVLVPRCEALFHDHLPSRRNPGLPTLLRALDETIP